MDMNEILRATQLLRSGSIKEATTLIQRALRGIQMPNMAANEATVERDTNIIDADYYVVDDIPFSPTNKRANDEPFVERFKQFRTPFTVKNWQEYFENIPGPTRAPQKQD